MSRPPKPTACPLCRTVLRQSEPVYKTVTTETYQVQRWTTAGPVNTGKTDVRYLGWYACEACARKEHPERFPTAESLQPLLDKHTANPDDWMASWQYRDAKELCYLEHRQCAWCHRPIWEMSGYWFAKRKRKPICCSPNCTNARTNASRAQRAKLARTPREATCVICHKKFAPTRRDARFCSNACRQKHYRRLTNNPLRMINIGGFPQE
jgi:hypothetical protein